MSPTTRRLFAAAALVAFVFAGAMVFVAIPANAQANRIAECFNFAGGASPASWMNLMINSGKAEFVQAGSHLCAW